MIIAIAGIKRSGSTVQYNLVRIALEQAGYKVNICGHNYRPREVPEGQVDLVKRHKFSKRIAEAADYIFLTDRSDEGIRRSLTRFNGKEPYEGRVQDMRKHLERWLEYTSHSFLFSYELWQNDPETYAMCICSLLGVSVNHMNVLEQFKQIEPPEKGQDKKTLLFHNHITSE